MRRSILLLAVAGTLALTHPAPAQYRDSADAIVRDAYARYLHRAADGPGYAAAVDTLRSGAATPEQFVIGLLKSDEYFTRAGDSTPDFARAVFMDVLGRPPTRDEFRHFTDQARVSRETAVAELIGAYPDSWRGPAAPRREGRRDRDWDRDRRRYDWR